MQGSASRSGWLGVGGFGGAAVCPAGPLPVPTLEPSIEPWNSDFDMQGEGPQCAARVLAQAHCLHSMRWATHRPQLRAARFSNKPRALPQKHWLSTFAARHG